MEHDDFAYQNNAIKNTSEQRTIKHQFRLIKRDKRLYESTISSIHKRSRAVELLQFMGDVSKHLNLISIRERDLEF